MLASEILHCAARVVSKLLSKDRNDHVVKTYKENPTGGLLVAGEKGTEEAFLEQCQQKCVSLAVRRLSPCSLLFSCLPREARILL